MDDISELRGEAARVPVHEVWTKGGPVFSRLSNETVEAAEGWATASFGRFVLYCGVVKSSARL
ncbi:MAG: hypothetical protein ACREE2_17170 [Stellaceae bacterium]